MTDLEKAFQDAKDWKIRRSIACDAQGEQEWQDPKTKFEKDNMDIMIDYDQNKNPDVVTPAKEEQLRFVMQVVQQQATSKFASLGERFTRDPELWIQFFARYPLLFNFRERESKHFEKKEFSLDANGELIEACLGANTPKNIADAFIHELRLKSGKVLETSQENEHLQYLTVIRSYDTASSITIYRAELKLEVSQVKTVCAGTQKQNLIIDYDRTVFEINDLLAYALYPSLMDVAKTELVKQLTEFFLQMAKEQFKKFDDWLNNPTK